MRNTADVIGSKPIAVLLQSISDVSAIDPLVAFYDIHGRKRQVIFFYFVPDTTRLNLIFIINSTLPRTKNRMNSELFISLPKDSLLLLGDWLATRRWGWGDLPRWWRHHWADVASGEEAFHAALQVLIQPVLMIQLRQYRHSFIRLLD
jgi:hypothetical protein